MGSHDRARTAFGERSSHLAADAQLGRGCLPRASSIPTSLPGHRPTDGAFQDSLPAPQSPRGSVLRAALTPRTFPSVCPTGKAASGGIWCVCFFFFIVWIQIQQCDKCIRATIRKIYSIRMRRSGQRGETRALQSPSYVSHYVTLVMGRQPDSK